MPLLDVVLQLIVFFLMLVHFGTQLEGAGLVSRLPVVSAARSESMEGARPVVVGIDAEGRLVAGEPAVAMEPAEAERWWAEEANRRGAGVEASLVLVRGDRGTTYGALRRVLAVAQRQGFVRFSLVVERERP
jgi:biopolymer transport protein ExbD